MNGSAQRISPPRGRWARYVDRVRAVWESMFHGERRAPSRVGPRQVWRLASERVLPNLPYILRLTGATVASYLVVGLVYPGSDDLTGALTALLVVRASLVETFSSGLDRVVSVLTGVLIATGVATLTGLTWWSLAVVVGASLVAAWFFDLGDNRLETAISAMLILGATTPDTSALERAGMTMLGAAVGFGSSLLFPPPVVSRRVFEGVPNACAHTAATLRHVADDMRYGMTPARFDVWIRSLHRVLPEIAAVDGQIRESENRRRYNPRAFGHDEAIPVLRSGLASIDRVILALRHLLMSLQARFPDQDDHQLGKGQHGTQRRADTTLEGVFAVVLRGVADAIDAYGALIGAMVANEPEAVAKARRDMNEEIAEARAMLTDLSLADPSGEYAWMLNPGVLSALEAVLSELSPERQHRRLTDWQARQSAAQVFPRPRGRDRRRGNRRARGPRTGVRGARDAKGKAPRTAASASDTVDPSLPTGPQTLGITFEQGLGGPDPLEPTTPSPRVPPRTDQSDPNG